MEKDESDALREKSVFLTDVGRMLKDISLLLEENRRIRADFEALSRITVTREQMLRHTALLSDVDSCLKRIGADNKRLGEELSELRKPDRRVGILEEEVRLLNKEIEKIKSGMDRPPDPRLMSRVSEIELKLGIQKIDIDKARSRAEDVSKELLHHKLRAGKRRLKYGCD